MVWRLVEAGYLQLGDIDSVSMLHVDKMNRVMDAVLEARRPPPQKNR